MNQKHLPLLLFLASHQSSQSLCFCLLQTPLYPALAMSAAEDKAAAPVEDKAAAPVAVVAPAPAEAVARAGSEDPADLDDDVTSVSLRVCWMCSYLKAR